MIHAKLPTPARLAERRYPLGRARTVEAASFGMKPQLGACDLSLMPACTTITQLPLYAPTLCETACSAPFAGILHCQAASAYLAR
jgi:hypothetical protein